MDERLHNQTKPLRSSVNPLKDINRAYGKNEDMRNIPIQEPNQPINEKEIHDEEIEKKIENAINIEEVPDFEFIDSTGLPEADEEELESEIQELHQRIMTLENERDKYKDHLVRLTAEMENLRRRTQKEKDELREYANEKLLFKLLEIPDDMNKALEAARKSSDHQVLLQGIEMIYTKTKKLFEEAGVKEMDHLAGTEFNVDLHDAILNTPSDKVPENHILQVVQAGYTIGTKVLRHAKVITSTGA